MRILGLRRVKVTQASRLPPITADVDPRLHGVAYPS